MKTLHDLFLTMGWAPDASYEILIPLVRAYNASPSLMGGSALPATVAGVYEEGDYFEQQEPEHFVEQGKLLH